MEKINLSQLSNVLEKQNSAVFRVGIDVHKSRLQTALKKGQDQGARYLRNIERT